ncbi:MAG: hypothetical protein V1827_04395 [Candidatus Micrarchaeota archaeon]
MTSGVCSRCGQRTEVEYGQDGQAYCSSCAFYGMNKQCWRCRMYLPAIELQQYRGQWTCPNCLQDMRADDRKSEERAMKKPHLEPLPIPETCDRCGKTLEGRVYILNGRRLCKSCVDHEQDQWGIIGGGPMASPSRVTMGPEMKRKKASLLESLFGDILHILGIRKKRIEVIMVSGKMPIAHAKPMAEKAAGGKKKEEPRPQMEGPMSITKDKKAPEPESRTPEERFSQKGGKTMKKIPRRKKPEPKQ